MSRRRLPRYVSEFKDRHGKLRVRFRRSGQEPYYFKATPWTPEFMAEYQSCLDRTAAPPIAPGATRTKAGSVSDLIVRYYASPEFTGLADSSRKSYRSVIERFRGEHGEKPVAAIERRHIKAILAAMHDRPAAANNLLDRLRTLMALAVDEGMRRDNPTHGVKGFRIASEGFHTWTEDEIAAFAARHPIGTKPRLAMALMLYTGQRRSDAVRMGWQHVAEGRIKVRQQKTKAPLEIPIHPELANVLAATPRDNLTFLMTEWGKPFGSAGFGNWFRERCDQAGLPQCSSHGLRKAAARRLAECGCSNQEIKSITGHRTDAEVARYTREAEQRVLAEAAFRKLRRKRKPGTNLANPPEKVSQNGD